MTVLDWLFVVIFVLLAVRGWMRGFIREVIGLAVVVVGLFLAFRLSTPFGVVVESLAGTSADVSRLIAGFVIVLALGIGATIVANVLHYGIKLMPGLSTLNRGAGVAFSVLAGAVAVAVGVSIVSLIPIPDGLAEELDDSTFASTVTDPAGCSAAPHQRDCRRSSRRGGPRDPRPLRRVDRRGARSRVGEYPGRLGRRIEGHSQGGRERIHSDQSCASGQ